MLKRILNSLLIALITVSVIACVLVFCNMIRGALADTEAHEIMAEAEVRIAAYESENTPVKERPNLVIVTYAPLETPTVDPVEDWYIEAIPLDKQLQKVVFEESCKNGVDYFTVLGLIQVESDFQEGAVNGCTGCFGLMQLNPAFFPSDLTPEENIQAGVEYLGQLLERYEGDVQAALTAYNAGSDTGQREYARAVLEAAGEIMESFGLVTK